MICSICGFDNFQPDICVQCGANLDPSDQTIKFLRHALKTIDDIAVSKKAGAAKRMQEVARIALAHSNGTQ